VHAFITYCTDYCNTVLAGAPKYVTDKLQRLLAAACLVSNTKKFDRGLSRLSHTDLHWLDIPERVQFKLCMTVRRCMQNKASQILTVDSVFTQPAVTFFLCHVIVELLIVGLTLLLVRRRGTLYLMIYVICHVAIVILDVS